MLPILDVDSAVDGLDKLGHASHGMSGEHFMGLLIGLVAVILIFGMPVFIVVAVLRHRLEKQRMVNELALRLADKGQAIPPELFVEAVRQKSDLRRGIIWAMVGLGILLFGAFDGDSDIMGIGFIPMMIGIGFTAAALLEKKQKEREL
ncbi:MAG: hypothetical protein JWR07_3009 [Nevskia sp.]|nr:hypothetical protein [Nevskia sp.]